MADDPNVPPRIQKFIRRHKNEAFTRRWTPLKDHPEQRRLWLSPARFRVVSAGRRSGKTEIAKRYGVLASIFHPFGEDGNYGFCAPTYQQAKKLYWKDLKKLVPKRLMDGKPSESELTIRLRTGTELFVAGLDKPERIEGAPLDGIVIDEIANVKNGEEAWQDHIRPALSTVGRPPGWAWPIGVPEGRNFYYEWFEKARSENPDWAAWDAFTWKSADIIDPRELLEAKRTMDPRTFRQEFEGSFEEAAGLVYYQWQRGIHAREAWFQYDPDYPLEFCFDFNVSPGIAVVCQHVPYMGRMGSFDDYVTVVVGCVWIPENSNTPAVCRKLIEDWKHHQGKVYVYGDATGGARSTTSEQGSDWAIIRRELLRQWPGTVFRVPSRNVSERIRVNALNSALETTPYADEDGLMRPGVRRMQVDPAIEHVIKDFEGTFVKEGTNGEIDKKRDPKRTHITDALGYRALWRNPLLGKRYRMTRLKELVG